MSAPIALLCEGPTDPRTICPLADRVIVDAVPWIDADEIDTHRHYRGFHPTDEYLRWDQIEPLALRYRVRSLGHFNGLPLHGDGHNTRKALALFTLHAPGPSIEAIIIFRDGDREFQERADAIRLVRDNSTHDLPIVVGVANRMRECWMLNGFVPTNDEQECYDAERQRVGYDPVRRAHDLAGGDGDDRCPKRVLGSLTANNHEREQACVARTPLDTLRRLGVATGLSDFITELESRLPVAFGR